MIIDLCLSREVNKISSSFKNTGTHFLYRYLASYLIFSLFPKEAGFKKKTAPHPPKKEEKHKKEKRKKKKFWKFFKMK